VEPEEEQDTSYLAASDNMVSFSMRFIINTPDIMSRISIGMKKFTNICSILIQYKTFVRTLQGGKI